MRGVCWAEGDDDISPVTGVLITVDVEERVWGWSRPSSVEGPARVVVAAEAAADRV